MIFLKHNNKGFSLLEMVITIVVLGILSVCIMGIVSNAFSAYIRISQDQAIANNIDYALRRMKMDLRHAVPLSARSSLDKLSLELLHIDNTFVPVNPATLSGSSMLVYGWDFFNPPGAISQNIANDTIVINHNGLYGASSSNDLFECPSAGNVYSFAGYGAGGGPGCTTAVSSQSILGSLSSAPNPVSVTPGILSNTTTLNFSSNVGFPTANPLNPVNAPVIFAYAVDTPVLYRCEGSSPNMVLRRYTKSTNSNYAIGQRIGNIGGGSTLPSGGGLLLLENISSCAFSVSSTASPSTSPPLSVDIAITAQTPSSNPITIKSRIRIDAVPQSSTNTAP